MNNFFIGQILAAFGVGDYYSANQWAKLYYELED